VTAQENTSKDEAPKEEEKPTPEERVSVTQHTLRLGDRVLAYTVTAGTIILKEEDQEKGEKPKASVFYIAYTLDGVEDQSQRPITFSFNGGPGSSSVWLHLGVLGPKRVLTDEQGNAYPPPYRLVENEYTLLDKTDLVFIDPVSTGYSRAVPGEKAEEFHNIKKDIESVGDFIRLYTTRNKRWASPKFLIGESYGTTRAAGLSGHLQGEHGMYLNGIMLVSTVLNFQAYNFDPGNDLPYILFLPTYTATAWYHNRLDASLQANLHKTLAEVEAFALNEYTLALMKGSTLAAEDRERIVEKLALYTGLSQRYIEQTDLRINIFRFTKELLRDQALTVGRLDSRFTGIDRDSAGEQFEFDPSYAVIQGVYTATLNQYVRADLQFESDLPYEILAPLYEKWKYDTYQNQYVNVAETLRQAIATNPALHVFVANGFYDLATPYFATRYIFNHLGLDEKLRGNISMVDYEAGHMMYIHLASLRQLKQDLAEFIDGAMQQMK
jgi:carboxypeptidase C (cathepsin A)